MVDENLLRKNHWSDSWSLNLQAPYFPVEIWKHRNNDLSIALRGCFGGVYKSKIVRVFNPGDEDYEIVLDLWYQQRHRIWHDETGFRKKRFWEFWK